MAAAIGAMTSRVALETPSAYAALVIGLVLVYLGCVETAKMLFFRRRPQPGQRLLASKNES